MATAAEVQVLRSSIDDLSTLAISDLNALLRQLGEVDPQAARDALLEAYPQLVDRYASVAGEVTATWYEQVRPNSGYAVAQGSVDAGQTNQLIRYGVRPLFGVGDATALSLLGGSLQRLIAGASRDTVTGNVDRERSEGKTDLGFARVPRSGCCAFCALLASRGAVYTSRRTAGEVDKYHDFCRCTVAPAERGEDLPYDLQKYRDLYYSVEYDGTKGTLANMRAAHGLK
ncbi:hypothetical protein QP735_04315 [Curtobacterium citreum]|uniref:VG15 protein n=1 Tax=Curtobacterium citreum TaxID=2036 RepID=UPI00254FF4AC|nr:hypothetical protein [Curtobacterium citreum]MDK8171748.1 hypothetical protein [Curtobacterium citreum]